MFHNLKLNTLNIPIQGGFWITDEFCPYSLFAVMYTIWRLPGCSAITRYNVSMSVSIHCFNFTIISPVGQMYPKVTKVFPEKRSSISNCTKSLNSPACIFHISSPTI